MSTARDRVKKLAPVLTAALISAVLGGYFFYQQAFFKPKNGNDIPMHIDSVLQSIRTGQWHTYTLYHKLVYYLALCKYDLQWVSWASIILLAVFISFKTSLSYKVINDAAANPPLSAGLSLISIMVMPVFNWWNFPAVYMGQISPNTWHNPTTILSYPFAFLLFLMMCRAFASYSSKDFAVIGALSVINLLVKPNYILAFLPVLVAAIAYDAFIARRVGILTAMTRVAIATVPTVFVLAYQYISTFDIGSRQGSVAILPLVVWNRYSPNIPASILLSLALPLAYIAVYPDTLKERRTLLCWGILLTSLVECLLLAQTGPKMYDGNFFWGAAIAIFVLFVNTIAGLFSKPRTARFYVVAGVFLLHLISGITFYYRAVSLFIFPYHASLMRMVSAIAHS